MFSKELEIYDTSSIGQYDTIQKLLLCKVQEPLAISDLEHILFLGDPDTLHRRTNHIASVNTNKVLKLRRFMPFRICFTITNNFIFLCQKNHIVP